MRHYWSDRTEMNTLNDSRRLMLARDHLIRILQHAHSGETAAIYAYEGHYKSLRKPDEISDVKKIMQDEIDHLAVVQRMLSELEATSDRDRDKRFSRIGRMISMICRIGGITGPLGWYASMYGAGRLEKPNTKEYEDAARYAHQCGLPEMADELLHLAEVEWDHEKYLRDKCDGHWLSHLIPIWKAPEPRDHIRDSFKDFVADGSS